MELASIPLEYVIRSAKIVKIFAYSIAVIGALASYFTQVDLLHLEWGLSEGFSYSIPLTIDMLAICAAIGLQVPNLPVIDRKLIGSVLVVALTVSIVSNILAGHSAGERAAHAWPVVAYMLAEFIANRISTFAARVKAVQEEAAQKESVRVAAEQAAKQAAEQQEKENANGHAARLELIKNTQMSRKARIIAIRDAAPHLQPGEIAEHAGTTVAWVKQVLKQQRQLELSAS